MKCFFFGVLWIVVGPLIGHGFNGEVEEVYYWKKVIYENLPLDKDAYIGPYRYFTPTNNNVLGVGYHASSGIMIVAMGRLRSGIPATLAAFCTSDYPMGSTPAIWGFPDYQKNTLKASFYEQSQNYYRNLETTNPVKYSPGYYQYFFGNIQEEEQDDTRKLSHIQRPLEDFNIISVYYPNVDDQCNRLYIIDTGFLYYGPSYQYSVQNPAIIVFDLQPNCCQTRNFPLIRRVEIPNNLWKNPVGFQYITPDYQGKDCDDVYLYITNCYDNNIIVYDYKREKFWSFTDPSMNPVIAESRMVYKNDIYYDLPIGIINVALGWPDKHGNKIAYYAPGASFGEYAVSTKVLKDSRRSYKKNYGDFFMLGYRGCNTQGFKQTFDPNTGVIFFAQMQSKKILCWNVRNPLNADTVGVVYESENLLFVTDIFIDSDNYLWFHSNAVPIYYLSDKPLDLTEINARSFRVNAFDSIRGTVCDSSVYTRGLYFNNSSEHYDN
ncbi:hypothetical protein DMENIID0001_086520 [Sergentomyia squamirostris]